MGKGDKKTKRGKIVIGSYGVRRAKKRKTFKVAPKVAPEIISEKKPAVNEPVINKAIEEKPVVLIQEPSAEIAGTEEHPAKKTTKKSTPKKTAEVSEEGSEPKPKAPKTKKKPEPTGEDLFTAKEE